MNSLLESLQQNQEDQSSKVDEIYENIKNIDCQAL